MPHYFEDRWWTLDLNKLHQREHKGWQNNAAGASGGVTFDFRCPHCLTILAENMKLNDDHENKLLVEHEAVCTKPQTSPTIILLDRYIELAKRYLALQKEVEQLRKGQP